MPRAFVFLASIPLLACSFKSPDATFEPESKKLTALTPEPGAAFGVGLATDGSALGVAEAFASDGNLAHAGAAYVYERRNGGWIGNPIRIPDQRALDGEIKLNLLPKDLPIRSLLGLITWPAMRIAMSASFVAVSLPGYSGPNRDRPESGRVCIYHRPELGRELECLSASDPHAEDSFGFSLALLESPRAGTRLVVGAPHALSNHPDEPAEGAVKGGAAYVFVYRDGHFDLEEKLVAEAPVLDDFFGGAVAVREDEIAVGAPAENSDATGVSDTDAPVGNATVKNGAVYTYRLSASGWKFEKYIKPLVPSDLSFFGTSLAFAGKSLAIGAPGAMRCPVKSYDAKVIPGVVYLAKEGEAGWSLRGEDCVTTTTPDHEGSAFGFVLSLSDDELLVGAPLDSYRTQFSGAVYSYDRNASAGLASPRIFKASRVEQVDVFGAALALAPDFIAVGKPQPLGKAGAPGEVLVYPNVR